MSISTSDPNPRTTTLNTIIVKENSNYIANFGLFASIAQHINLHLILHDVYINDPTIVSDVKLNSWIFNYLECY